MPSEFKITLRKDSENSYKWWVEGFENCEIQDKDINEISDFIDISKEEIIEKLKVVKQIKEITK